MNWGTQLDRAEALVVVLQLELLLLLLLYSILFFVLHFEIKRHRCRSPNSFSPSPSRALKGFPPLSSPPRGPARA